ncbi:hypothetical protein [Georhizobium profundi]|uniref:hypothetical protein n=1 Tax=Georhizobium profundi TaxID=2341112 RepID=UPI000F7D67B4|nr:hypothetical protein [Georhizobium profundi]
MEIAQSCAHYEHEEFDGEVIFGGRLLDVHEGAIWKAHDLECRLRALLAAIDQLSARNGWSDNGEREAARSMIAEIESLGRLKADK